uniref:Uncharacterized protein n=1 Tax=Anguilla anguilla TaxID=7936 RepID=A0A0E9U0D8_ANGAN
MLLPASLLLQSHFLPD